MWNAVILAPSLCASLTANCRADRQDREKSMPTRMFLNVMVSPGVGWLTIMTGHRWCLMTPSTVLPIVPLILVTPLSSARVE